MRMTSKITLAAIGAAMLGATVANAAPTIYDSSTPLDVLIAGTANGDAIISGDKIFFNFTYTKTGDMPAASGVNVIPIVDGQGNLGIRFQGGFLDLVGGGPSDALITYDVLVLDEDKAISDAHIYGNPVVIGSGVMAVTETWLPDVGNAYIRIYDIKPGGTELHDEIDFLPTTYKLMHVQKDILANAGNQEGSAATLSFVDQTYSQVPEPASLGMLAVGAAGLLFRRRKA